MRRVVTVLAVLAAVPAFGADWVEVKSPAFTVVSDGGEKDARRVLSQFEQVRAVLKEAWPWANVDPSRPVTIVAMRDGDEYRRLVPAARQAGGAPLAAAILVPAPDRNWVALRMDVSRFQESDDTWDHAYRSAVHDYVHLVLHLNYVQLPAWLEEGLAEFWGNTIVDGDRVDRGARRPLPSVDAPRADVHAAREAVRDHTRCAGVLRDGSRHVVLRGGLGDRARAHHRRRRARASSAS